MAPLTVRAVNHHDTTLFPESLEKLGDVAELLELDLEGSYLTLDPGFDSEYNRSEIRFHKMIPVIKPIARAKENPEKLAFRQEEFDKLKHIYKERYRVERTFAWQDTYRKLVTRYEKLQCTFLGFRNLAYSMINLRIFFSYS